LKNRSLQGSSGNPELGLQDFLSAKKLEAITLVWMMAPKLTGVAVLGCHHLPGVSRTRTVWIRTTTLSTGSWMKLPIGVRSSLMALRNIGLAIKLTALRWEVNQSN
jgi:hypothetical protein